MRLHKNVNIHTYMYVCACWRVSFPPPTRKVFFFSHLMPLSPLPALPPIPHMVPHPYLSLWTAAHSSPPPLAFVLFPPFPPGVFQFQTISPLHPRLSFIPPLGSLARAAATSRRCGQQEQKLFNFTGSPRIKARLQGFVHRSDEKNKTKQNTDLRSIFHSS